METLALKTWIPRLLIAGALLCGVSGCMEPEQVEAAVDGSADRVAFANTPPVISQLSQSASSVLGFGTVTFHVAAHDAETSELTFSWTANVGDLGFISSTGSTSDLEWTAPQCMPASTVATITASASDGAALASESFTVAVPPCLGPAVDAGLDYSLVLRGNGTVWGWGRNNLGQLGDGTTTQRITPVQVSGLTGVTAIATGLLHALALRSDGTVWSWGDNSYAQLGDGTTTRRLTPGAVPGLTQITAIATSSSHGLALRGDGTVWAWGYNTNGQLGDGTTTQRLTPVQVPGLTGVTAIRASGSFSLALRGDGTVWAWGNNWWGQLGNGAFTSGSFTPVQVPGLTGVTAIETGDLHALALRSNGTVWGWGYNSSAALGDGSTTNRATPVQVSGLTGVTAIAAGEYHSMARRGDDTFWAWGTNYEGRLGDGTTTHRLAPVQVAGMTGVTAFTGGSWHSLALRSDGTVWAWGDNSYYQLGDGTTTDRLTPMQVPGLTSFSIRDTAELR